MTERHQSFSEEIANSITHGLFLLASVAATPYLIAKAIQTKNNLIIFTTCIFTTTVILVYFISTLYHAMPRSKKKVDRQRMQSFQLIWFYLQQQQWKERASFFLFPESLLRGTEGKNKPRILNLKFVGLDFKLVFKF